MNIVKLVDLALREQGTYTSMSESAAHRYKGSCDILSVLNNADATAIPEGMDTLSIQAFSKNGPSGRWTITRGRVVAVTCRDPILVRIVLLESSPSIEGIKLSFPERGLELLNDCVEEELTGEAQYLRPYASTISDDGCGIGGPLIAVLDDEKPIEQFLVLKERIEVAFLVSDNVESRCVGLGVLDECSP